jgi:CRP/FNR family transcriptional regulator, cyclic AMP receptor protein
MWKAATGGSRDRPVRVLDADPDLGIDLDPNELAAATAELVAPLVQIEWARNPGRWGPAEPRGHLGLLLVDGVMLREVQQLGAFSAEVLGPGDLLRPWDVDLGFTLPEPADVQWTVLAPASVAVLGEQFLARAARRPSVLGRLAGRSVSRAHALALHDALTNLKHVETRLLVQFWHLAERWGRVRPGSISIAVPLTHEMLAKLVGATRPSVTTALGRLAARGLLTRDAGGVWLLHPDARHAVEPLPVQPDTRLPA